jgi:hypothetical protein
MKAIAMTDLSALAPARRAAAQPSTASAAAAATPSRIRRVFASLARWLRARLHAHARRQVALALGERVAELNQAIKTGAETRRQLEREKENQP